MILKSLQQTFSCNFGTSRTGKTVTVSILDSTGSVLGSGYTAGSVFELTDGNYAAAITFSSAFTGFIKWSNTTDGIELYEPIVVIDDYRADITLIKKVEVNRWKISSNQLTIYDDDGVTALKVFNMKKLSAADGGEPDERVPV